MNVIIQVMEFLELINALEIIVIIMTFILARQWLFTKAHENIIKENRLIYDTKIDISALEALDGLIKETLEEYQVFHLSINQDLTYINNKMEKEILDFLQSEVSKRISTLLLKKLEYLYNKDYVGTAIGTRIYLAVLDFVLEFNTKNHTQNEENK